jgi:hypothetical protein
MNLLELEAQIAITLNHFRVKFYKSVLSRGISSQFIVEDFGLLICCINRVDYAEASCAINEGYQDWRNIYITTGDSISEKRYTILWGLMRGGYMKWLRYKHPRQVRSALNGPENLGQKIIEERLRVWGNKPKYRFFIEDNLAVLHNGIIRELSSDPGFFDYMPEEE